eukprot:gnl/TRDRNA2_/TRDRNA2_175841_c0_seq1.p1 gnl/TRDRNA2_/TRDRNA2_175841_c0~~gnl/TRDRNA2_/TRDRNA2_175841_c0_seq1.p1  ORF type:complete len:253 (-),score=21.18 gnl/TRDRNA2_/TRDRNA2_175841_c0_seq1:143-901(-)
MNRVPEWFSILVGDLYEGQYQGCRPRSHSLPASLGRASSGIDHATPRNVDGDSAKTRSENDQRDKSQHFQYLSGHGFDLDSKAIRTCGTEPSTDLDDSDAGWFDYESFENPPFYREDSSSYDSGEDEPDADDECGVCVNRGLGPVLDSNGKVVGVREVGRSEPARFSYVWSVKAAGLASIGSWHHRGGQCSICTFQDRHLQSHLKADWSKGPCRKGVMCDRCHEHHEKPKKADSGKQVWAYKPRGGKNRGKK